jgi:hypothetical protein
MQFSPLTSFSKGHRYVLQRDKLKIVFYFRFFSEGGGGKRFDKNLPV